MTLGLGDEPRDVRDVPPRLLDGLVLALELGAAVGDPHPEPVHVLGGGTDHRLAVVLGGHGLGVAAAPGFQTARRFGVPRAYLVCGNPRSTFDVAGSGQRDVTTFERV